MAPITKKQQNAEDFIAVKRQALVDKEEVLDAIDTRMSKLGVDHDLLIVINGKLDTFAQVANKHEKVIYGNGEIGLIRKVDELKNCTDDIGKRHKAEDQGKRDMNKNLWAIWVAIIADLVATVIALVIKIK